MPEGVKTLAPEARTRRCQRQWRAARCAGTGAAAAGLARAASLRLICWRPHTARRPCRVLMRPQPLLHVSPLPRDACSDKAHWHAAPPHACADADSEEDDPELLLHVPFDGSVKLTGITVVGGPEGTAPAKLKVQHSGGQPGAPTGDACSCAVRIAAWRTTLILSALVLKQEKARQGWCPVGAWRA